MTLFSSFNHIAIFLLFTYLGLVSGIVFNCTNYFSILLQQRIKNGLEISILNKNKQKSKQLQKETIKNEYKGKNKRKNNILKIIYIKFKKLKSFLFKNAKKIICLILKILPVLVFINCIVFSYLVNLKLNFGYLRLVYVFIWFIFFIVSKTLCKIVANYFMSFYNYFIKRINKNGREKQ